MFVCGSMEGGGDHLDDPRWVSGYINVLTPTHGLLHTFMVFFDRFLFFTQQQKLSIFQFCSAYEFAPYPQPGDLISQITHSLSKTLSYDKNLNPLYMIICMA